MRPRQRGDRRVSRGRNWQRGVGLAVLVSGLWLTTTDAQAQSLGELAAREAARRATIATPSPVRTNDARPDQDTAAPPAPPVAVIPDPPMDGPGRAAADSAQPRLGLTACPLAAARRLVHVPDQEDPGRTDRDRAVGRTAPSSRLEQGRAM